MRTKVWKTHCIIRLLIDPELYFDTDVCKFFQQGNCRYGDNCRFYHPRGQTRRLVCSRTSEILRLARLYFTEQNSGFYRSQGGSDRVSDTWKAILGCSDCRQTIRVSWLQR